MPTPFLINTSLNQVGQPLLRHWQGPFQKGTALYVGCANVHEIAGPDTLFLSVFKSLDGGQTWAEQDAANAPEFTSGGSALIWGAATDFQIGETTIHCAYIDASFDLNLIDFDMTTDTWGSPITGGPHVDVGGGVKPVVLLNHLSDGTTLVCFMSGSVTLQVWWTLYSGSWSAAALVGAAGNTFLHQTLRDGADGVHIIYQNFSGSNQPVFHKRWAAGVLSSVQTIYTEVGGSVHTKIDYGMYNATRDEVSFPFGKSHPGFASVCDSSILRGTPASNPTFTVEDTPIVYDPVEDTTFFWPVWAMTDGDREVILSPGNGFTQHQIYMTEKIAGVWSTPTVFWDLDVDPPTPPPGIDTVEFSSATILADDSLGVTTGMFTPVTADFCDVQYYLFTTVPVTDATVTFNKTVIGGTAVPTDFTLQFWQSGALIALAAVGHTVTLAPGDYELIELGPSGYTTSYTLTGTGGSLTGNTLTVSNGDDVTVTATNTQGGQPEASCSMGAGGIPVGSSPTGCFELLRVVATFRPARHLPVRGSNR